MPALHHHFCDDAVLVLCSTIAAIRRRVWAATAFLVMMFLDCAMGIAIGVISWMAGGSFNVRAHWIYDPNVQMRWLVS